MCYGLHDVKPAAVAEILEGRKHPKYYYSYNAARSYKDWFYDLDEFIETPGGAEAWCMWVGLWGIMGLLPVREKGKGCGGSEVTVECGTQSVQQRAASCDRKRVLKGCGGSGMTLACGTQECTAVGCVGGLTHWSFLNAMLFFRHVSIEDLINQDLVHVNKYSIYGCLFDHSIESWKKKPTRNI